MMLDLLIFWYIRIEYENYVIEWSFFSKASSSVSYFIPPHAYQIFLTLIVRKLFDSFHRTAALFYKELLDLFGSP